MSADELLTTCRAAGIILRAQGNTLEVDAPHGALTPELRDTLAKRKRGLLALLSPPREYATLRPLPGSAGMTLPLPALELAWELERRGFEVTLGDMPDTVRVEPARALTEGDRASIARWRRHLAALTAYCSQVCEVPS